jgi:hypothetical protein
MEIIIKLNEIFPSLNFLGARMSGEMVREQMEKAIDNGDTVVLDFDGIEDITQGFGDEIVGIFTRAYGKEFVKKNIKVVNYSEEIKVVLNWVVSYSSKYYKERQEELNAVRYFVNEHPELIETMLTKEQMEKIKEIVLKDLAASDNNEANNE